MTTDTIQTKYGKAKINKDGYYVICSKKEGNYTKQLHRLVFEDFYQIKLPQNIVIHHEDENKTNNEIWNLIPMTFGEHNTIHHKGKKWPLESRQRMSELRSGENHPNYGKNHSDKSMVQMSKTRTATGYYRVSKNKKHDVNQGFVWKYQYYIDGKRKSIVSVNLKDLKDKVVSRGLKWDILDKDLAMESGLV